MKQKENYLEKIPVRKTDIECSTDENNIVTLKVENKGAMNYLFQKLLRKPRYSYIHLDEMGSFVWPLIDGEKDIFAIGKEVEKHFGEKANPLYERLSQYFEILKNNNFIEFK